MGRPAKASPATAKEEPAQAVNNEDVKSNCEKCSFACDLETPYRPEKLTAEALSRLYPMLAAPLPEDAIQRAETKEFKGYNTTGIGYQFAMNRFNEVVGPSHWRTVHHLDVEPTPSGKQFTAVCTMTVEIGNWENGVFVPIAVREGYGGHDSKSKADALKGAYTNAFKKACSGFGVGRQAYEGTLDEDNFDPEGYAPAATVGKQQFSNGNRPAPRAQAPVDNTPAPRPTPAPAPRAESPARAQATAEPDTVPQAKAQPPAGDKAICPDCGKTLAATDKKFCEDKGIELRCWKCRAAKK